MDEAGTCMSNMCRVGASFMKCTLCDQAAIKEFFPFCSKACQQQDLLCWLQGHYCIPGNEPIVNSHATVEEDDNT